MDYVKWNPMRRCVLALLIVFPFFVNSAWSQTGTFTKIIPQIAIGSFDGGATKYSTVIEIIKSNVISVNVSANFFNEDGSATNLNFTTNSSTIPTIINGTLTSLTLDPNKVLVISGGTTPGSTPSSGTALDRKSTRLKSSHGYISYAVFFLKKKKKKTTQLCVRII